MRYCYDFEFLEDGWTIETISVGIVAEDGREYYAVNRDAPWVKIREHAWLMANVVPQLPSIATDLAFGRATPSSVPASHPIVKPRWQIAAEVAEFLGASSKQRDDNQLIAYYAAYDHVALCQLWGRMIDLPPWVPMFSHDLESMARGLEQVGFPAVRPEQTGEHNALEDARWNLRFWQAQVEATNAFMESVSVPVGHVSIAAPTAARLIERMISEGPNEGISADEERDLRQWWETYSYPPGEPEAGDAEEAPAESRHLEERRVEIERGRVA